MKRSILLFIVTLLVSCAHSPSHEGLQDSNRQRPHFIVTLTTVPPQPHVGENLFRSRLTDAAGAPIADAQVMFELRMKEMRFMRRVARGRLVDDGVYEATIDLNMGGEWVITVEVERPGFEIFQEKFMINAGAM